MSRQTTNTPGICILNQQKCNQKPGVIHFGFFFEKPGSPSHMGVINYKTKDDDYHTRKGNSLFDF